MPSLGTLRRSASSGSPAGAAADSPPPGVNADGTRSHPHRKRWIAAGVVVVLIGAGLGTYFGTRKSKSSSGALLQQTTETVSVTTGTIKQAVSASGTIEPGEDDALNFEVSGQVNSVDVTAGQNVTKGQKLATLDTTALSDDVAAAESSLTAAEDKLTTDEDDSAVASQIDSDESSVNSAENSLTGAQTDLADATLTSPISGTIASVNLTVGEEVSASGGGAGNGDSSTSSSSSSSSSGQITVINTGSFTVSASVSDTEIGGIKVGDQAVITPSGSTSTVYGVVSSVGLIADDSSDVATFPVTISVTGSPSGLYAGSSANVSIITEQLNNVTEVPTAAISYANGSATVTMAGSNKVVDITTGASASAETQVTKGVSPGDKVLERVVKFNRSALTGGSGSRSLLGGTGTRSFGGGGGAFFGGGGGTVRFSPGGAGGFGG